MRRLTHPVEQAADPDKRESAHLVGGHVWRSIDRNSKWILTLAVGFVIVVAGAYALHFGDTIRFPDEGDYLSLARSVATGHGYQLDGLHPSAYRAPGFPLLLAPFRLLDVPITGLRAVNVVLLGVTVVLAWMIAAEAAGRVAAALAAVGTAIYPLTFFTASTFYPETLASALLCGAVLCFIKADRRNTESPKRRAVLLAAAGLFSSMLFLTVPTFAVIFPLALVWYVLGNGRPALSAFACCVGLFVLPMALWTARNAIQLSEFIPATTGAGYNLLLGNSEHTTYGSGVNADISRYSSVVKARRLNEVQTDRYFRQEAIAYIRAHPGRFVRLWVGKTANHFAASNRLATDSQSSRTRDLLAALTYYPLLALLLGRVIMTRRRVDLSRPEWLLLVIYLVPAPIMAIFVTRVRYRAPLDALLLVLLAIGVERVILALRK